MMQMIPDRMPHCKMTLYFLHLYIMLLSMSSSYYSFIYNIELSQFTVFWRNYLYFTIYIYLSCTPANQINVDQHNEVKL